MADVTVQWDRRDMEHAFRDALRKELRDRLGDPQFRPVFQTRYGAPAGNCTEACIASILGVPLEDVPDLYKECRREALDGNWFRVLNDWLKPRGLALARVALLPDRGLPIYLEPNTLVIAGGPEKTPAGPKPVGHYCIYRFGGDFELVHDPHEGWEGLERIEDLLLIVRAPITDADTFWPDQALQPSVQL